MHVQGAFDKAGQERLLIFGVVAATEGRMHAERIVLEMQAEEQGRCWVYTS